MSDERSFAGKNSLFDSPVSTPPLGVRSIFQISGFDDFARESLGILDLNRESLGFYHDDAARESLGIINLDNLDTGRDSLGISNIKTYDFTLSKGSLPTISDEDETTKNVSTIAQTSISEFQVPTFSSVMNDALRNTTDFVRRMQVYLSPTIPTKSPLRKAVNNKPIRNASLPSLLDENVKSEAPPSLHLSCNDADNSDTDTVFNVDQSISEQDYMLDSTQEPADFANILDIEDPIKCETDAVFKTIDKLFISTDDNLSTNHETLNSPRRDSSSSKSKDPMEMIDALADYLNDNCDEVKKTEGQNILANLAEFFHLSASTKSQSCDFHYSETVRPLRKKSRSETSINHLDEDCVPLDLSIKSRDKAFTSPKMLPPKFSKTRQMSLTNIKVNQSRVSNCSTSSNEGRNSSDSKMFRPKKSESKVAGGKKGPMKAVLPINTMAKTKTNNLKLTPKNSESTKLKKSVTPINGTNFKPIGQSTPDYPKNGIVSSPLARPNLPACIGSKIVKPKLSSFNRSSDGGNKFAKTRSSIEIKKTTESSNKTAVRARSLDRKVKPSSHLGPQRNSFSHPTHTSVLKDNNKVIRRPSITKKVGKENK